MRLNLRYLRIALLLYSAFDFFIGGRCGGFLRLDGAMAAQFTTVSGTVTDPNGLPYANGTIVPIFVTTGTPIFTATNSPYAPPTQPVGLSATGSFVMQLADNTALSPGGTKWNFQVCSGAGSIQPAGGKGPVCFSLASPITISGAAQSITAALGAAALPLSSAGGAGTITGVTAGTGLNGGGVVGTVTLNLNAALPNGETATTQALGDSSTQVATDAFVLANAPGFTAGVDGSAGYVSGDPCATITTNLAAAIALNPQSIDLYTGGFAKFFTNGIVPCNSNPYENQVFSGRHYLGPLQFVKSVPWVTPGNNQRFGMYGDGTSDPGVALPSINTMLTDCDSDAPGWNGAACVIGAVTVAAFPSTGHCIGFTYPHGSFGAATYCPTLWLGGMGAAGVTFGGSFGDVIQDFSIQPGNGGGNFGVYSSSAQEQSVCQNVVVRASNNAAFFFDKVQGNGSGPGHWAMSECTGRAGINPGQAPAQGYPNVANQIGMGYGIWAEGNGIVVYFTGGTCTTYPQGYPTTIAGGAITAIKMTYAGTCSNVTGLACHIGTQHGGTAETCAPTTVGNTVTGITAGGVGSNYNLSDTQTGAPFEIANATINGKNTQSMRASIVLDGLFSPHVRSIHTGYNADWGVIVGYGSGVIIGGLFENVDLENTSNGEYRFGVGIDNNQMVLSTGRGGSVASIQDDNNNFTSGTNVPCSLYEPGTMNTCNTGGVFVMTDTLTSSVVGTVNAISGQTGDLMDWDVNSVIQASMSAAGVLADAGENVTTAANATTTPVTITQGAISTNFPTALLNVVQGANTGATNVPAVMATGTWNNAGLVGPFVKIALTNTSSAANSPILQVFGGAAGNTSEFNVTTAGNVISPTSFQSALFQGPTIAGGTQFCGGPCTASLAGTAGISPFQGGDNSNVGAATTAGSAVFRAGELTNATPNAAALEGVVQLGSGALKGAALAAFGDAAQSTTTAFTVTDASHTTPILPILGCVNSIANPIGLVGFGQALCKIDSAVAAIGDVICMGNTTDGNAHDNGTAMCLKPGSLVGTVIADSGTINTMAGSSTALTAMSTTLVLVQLAIGGGGPATQMLAAQYTNAATTTYSTVFTFPVQPSQNIHVACQFYYQGSAVTAVPSIQFTGPAAPTSVRYGMRATLTSGASPTYYDITTSAGYSTKLIPAAIVTTATDMNQTVTFDLQNGTTGGNVLLQAAPNGAGTLTYQVNSACVESAQ
jgi:hypothetical protein